MCFGQLGLDAWSTAIRIILATIEVGSFASHEGLEMFKTEMHKVLMPKQQFLLHASQIGICRIQNTRVWKHTGQTKTRCKELGLCITTTGLQSRLSCWKFVFKM